MSYFYNRYNIDWNLISEAVKYYTSIGYKYVEVPWIVSSEAIQATFNGTAPKTKDGLIVGSAEQSFIQMKLDGTFPFLHCGAKLVTVTPCFKNDEIDRIHSPFFMKVELININNNLDDSDVRLQSFIKDAKTFFEMQNVVVDSVKTESGVDLLIDGIEIGSYGIRSYNSQNRGNFNWVYGTGLAEPRFSIASTGRHYYVDNDINTGQ